MKIKIIGEAIVHKLEEEINEFIESIESSGGDIIDINITIDDRKVPVNSYAAPYHCAIIKYEYKNKTDEQDFNNR